VNRATLKDLEEIFFDKVDEYSSDSSSSPAMSESEDEEERGSVTASDLLLQGEVASSHASQAGNSMPTDETIETPDAALEEDVDLEVIPDSEEERMAQTRRKRKALDSSVEMNSGDSEDVADSANRSKAEASGKTNRKRSRKN